MVLQLLVVEIDDYVDDVVEYSRRYKQNIQKSDFLLIKPDSRNISALNKLHQDQRLQLLRLLHQQRY
jgi:hypothetical protein